MIDNRFFEVVCFLQGEGKITPVFEWETGAITARNDVPWRDVAQFASASTGGQWTAFKHACKWQLGSLSFWIVESGHAENIERARTILRDVTGIEGKYSVGGCAGAMMRWAVEPARKMRKPCKAFADTEIAYHECTPGHFEKMTLFDMKACYPSIMKRLPSMRMSVLSDGDIVSHPMLADEKAKMCDVWAALDSFHLMRSCLWGTSLGSVEGGTFYHEGKKRASPPYTGPYHVMALLTARIAYELTCVAAAQTNAVYAMTDSVMCSSGKAPTIWDYCGMEYGVKASGSAHVLLQHRYKIGDKATEWYRLRGDFSSAEPRKPIPLRTYFQDYLT